MFPVRSSTWVTAKLPAPPLKFPRRARLQISLVKGQKINWRRFENDDATMSVGAYRPLGACLRIRFHGTDRLDA